MEVASSALALHTAVENSLRSDAGKGVAAEEDSCSISSAEDLGGEHSLQPPFSLGGGSPSSTWTPSFYAALQEWRESGKPPSSPPPPSMTDSWTPLERQAFAALLERGEALLMEELLPGERPRCGGWNFLEQKRFVDALALQEAHPSWGAFSTLFSGRTGKQCQILFEWLCLQGKASPFAASPDAEGQVDDSVAMRRPRRQATKRAADEAGVSPEEEVARNATPTLKAPRTNVSTVASDVVERKVPRRVRPDLQSISVPAESSSAFHLSGPRQCVIHDPSSVLMPQLQKILADGYQGLHRKFLAQERGMEPWMQQLFQPVRTGGPATSMTAPLRRPLGKASPLLGPSIPQRTSDGPGTQYNLAQLATRVEGATQFEAAQAMRARFLDTFKEECPRRMAVLSSPAGQHLWKHAQWIDVTPASATKSLDPTLLTQRTTVVEDQKRILQLEKEAFEGLQLMEQSRNIGLAGNV